VLLGLGGAAPAFLSALSFRQRARLAEELRTLYALYEHYGADDLRAAMALAEEAGVTSAAAVAGLLRVPHAAAALPPAVLPLPGVPPQAEVDRLLSSYEAWVQVDVALAEVRS
jgi:hypothetical protein